MDQEGFFHKTFLILNRHTNHIPANVHVKSANVHVKIAELDALFIACLQNALI